MSEQANSDQLPESASERHAGVGEPQQPRQYGRRAVMFGAAAAGVGAAASLAAAPAAQASSEAAASGGSRSEAVRKVVGDALESASTASIISELVATREFAGPLTIQPSVITINAQAGSGPPIQLKISTLTMNTSSTVEIVQGSKVIDPAPSGTFKVSGSPAGASKTLTIERGRLIGGTAATGEMRDWAVFALLPISMAGEI